MGMLDRLMFWKQEEPDMSAFRQPDPMQFGLHNDPLGQQDPSQDSPAPFSTQQFGTQQGQQQYSPSFQPAQFGQQNQFGSGAMTNQFARPASFQQLEAAQPAGNVLKEIEILSAKIDALRASVETMNQRIIAIENIARDSQKRW